MKRWISRAEVRSFKKRWEFVNAAERKKLRATPVIDKLRQLAALMALGEELGWTQALAAEDTEVHDRWNRLRKVLGG